MSEESATPNLVELLRRSAQAANRGHLDAVKRLYAPDAVLDTTRTPGVAPRGRAAIQGQIEDWMSAYEESEGALEEPVDLGNGVVFAVAVQKARPVGTSGYVQQREGWVYICVDDLIASITVYPEADFDEARAAAERLARPGTVDRWEGQSRPG